MTVNHAPVMPYNSPTFPHATRGSRSSSRASVASPRMDSPRTACPPDGDAFSFNPAHLFEWYISEDMWQSLPSDLQASLAAMQRAGAAVLTGFQRIDEHNKNLSKGKVDSAPKLETPASPIHSVCSPLSLPQSSNADSICSSQPETSSNSSVFFSSPSSVSVSPPVLSLSGTSPVSPLCLTPSDAQFASAMRTRGSCKRERSFSTPLEPHDAYYATELSQLRTESLPRLRHAVRKVDTVLYDIKRAQSLPQATIDIFETSLTEKKILVQSLDEDCKRRSEAAGVTSSGMGWTAP